MLQSDTNYFHHQNNPLELATASLIDKLRITRSSWTYLVTDNTIIIRLSNDNTKLAPLNSSFRLVSFRQFRTIFT